jgi:hypothetical protein
MLWPGSLSPAPGSASLSIRDAESKAFGKLDGLWYVDSYRFNAPHNRIYIAPGHRIVGYQCPGWISMDDFPSLKYTFAAGKSYEMVCESKGPVIYPSPG